MNRKRGIPRNYSPVTAGGGRRGKEVFLAACGALHLSRREQRRPTLQLSPTSSLARRKGERHVKSGWRMGSESKSNVPVLTFICGVSHKRIG